MPLTADQACAGHILNTLSKALEEKPHASLAISGGSSPRPMFEHFAQIEFPWDRVHLFWVDERAVPPIDAQSNFKLANDTWLLPGNFPKANIHRIVAELDPHEAAARYIADLRDFLQLAPGAIPVFDIVHQGMGPDAHTASLFPGEPLIDDRTNLAAAVYAQKFAQWRITLLPAVLIAARHTAMLVTGADKTDAVRAVLHGAYDPLRYPSQVVARNAPDVAWFFDEALAKIAS